MQLLNLQVGNEKSNCINSHLYYSMALDQMEETLQLSNMSVILCNWTFHSKVANLTIASSIT